jgi:hypothetical protein
VLITLGLPAKTYAATDGCPDTWTIDLNQYPNQELVNAKKRLGVNMAETSQSKVVEFKGPLGEMPRHNLVEGSYVRNPLVYLYSDSKVQTIITIEVKGCPNKGTFSFINSWIPSSSKTFELITAAQFSDKFPDKFSDFKQQENFSSSVRDLEQQLKGMPDYYIRNGIKQIPFLAIDAFYQQKLINTRIGRFNTLALTPKCLNRDNESSVVLIGGSGECKFAIAVTLNSGGFSTTYIFEPFTINLPSNYSITCIKGKTTKKVSGTNPKCPKGYKVKV